VACLVHDVQCHELLLDRFVPQFDEGGRHQILVNAPAAVTFAVAQEVSLRDSWIIRTILRTREQILGSKAKSADLPAKSLIEETKSIGWGELASLPGKELVMGAITQPWAADVVFRAIPPEQFATYTEPNHVKIAWTLRVEAINETQSVFRTETRVVACDAKARSRMLRYWIVFSPGILLIRMVLIRLIRREAERRYNASRFVAHSG
jgi:hypothetical protein